MKKNKTFKLSPESFERIERLTEAENTSQAHIVELALQSYELKQQSFRRDFMQLWEKLNTNIEKLQIKRDYSAEELSKEESETLDWYFEIWEQFRKQPFYSEVVPPELDL